MTLVTWNSTSLLEKELKLALEVEKSWLDTVGLGSKGMKDAG